MENKSQSSVEYLVIIALTLGIIVPTTYLYFNYGSETNVRIIDAQINQIGRSMIDTAENVYYSGESSKIILQLNMPDNVRNAFIINNRELVLNVTTVLGENEAVFFSAVNITSSSCADSVCSLNDIASVGSQKVKFESVSNGKQVLISKSG